MPKTYLDYYKTVLSPKLERIDLFLKTAPQPYGITESAALLDLSITETEAILRQLSVCCITRPVFLFLLQEGSSALCELLRRQLLFPNDTYTLPEIAYIYDLRREDVFAAAARLGLSSCHKLLLPLLFDEILMPDTRSLL